MLAIESPLPLFVGLDGLPLDAGYIYFGTTNLNPVTSPVTVYWDAAGTQPVAQPVRTSNGLIVRNGTPASVYSATGFSMLIKDSAGRQVNYARSSQDWQLRDALLDTSSSTTGAGMVAWIRAATGAVAYTLGVWLGWQKPNWLEFMTTAERIDVLARTAALDVTTAVQAAINASVSENRILECPGVARITDTLLLPNKTQMRGEHDTMGFDGGSKIIFAPTSLKSLFEPTGLPATLKDGYLIEGFQITGNTSSSAGVLSGFSDIGIDIDNIIKSTFRNIRVQGFRTGIRCYATNSNQLFGIHATDNHVQSVLYDGGLATTDCWWGGYISNAPTLVQTTDSTSSIRWFGVTFEGAGTNSALSTTKATGVNLVKETEGWMFSMCYGEDAPNTNNADNAMIRVGEDGTTLPGATQVTIEGGKWGGRNAGGTGSFLHVDYTDGVVFGGGAHVSRFTNVVRTTANTAVTQVMLTGFTCGSVSTIVTDDTKVTGFYPLTAFNGSSRNNQTHRFAGDNYNAPDSACTGAITTVTNWKLTKNGGSVTLTLPNVVGTAAAQPYWEYAEVIPSKYRPSASLAFGCVIRNNAANLAQPGMVIVSAAGVIRVYLDGAGTNNFTAAAEAGFGQSCGTEVSWTV